MREAVVPKWRHQPDLFTLAATRGYIHAFTKHILSLPLQHTQNERVYVCAQHTYPGAALWTLETNSRLRRLQHLVYAAHPLWFVCIHCAVCTRRERKGLNRTRRHRNFASSGGGVVCQRCQNFSSTSIFLLWLRVILLLPLTYLVPRTRLHRQIGSNSAYKHLPGGLPQLHAQWLQTGDNHVGSPWSNWLKGEKSMCF